jgi:hypothetical protein
VVVGRVLVEAGGDQLLVEPVDAAAETYEDGPDLIAVVE